MKRKLDKNQYYRTNHAPIRAHFCHSVANTALLTPNCHEFMETLTRYRAPRYIFSVNNRSHAPTLRSR